MDNFIKEPGSVEGTLKSFEMLISNTPNINIVNREIPEGCKLVAHDTGDGWYLAVEDRNGKEVAILAWPKSWPEKIFPDDLRKFGFEII